MTAIDAYDAYTVNVAYPDAFTAREKQETVVKLGVDAALQVIPGVKVLAPTNFWKRAYDAIGIGLDVAGLYNGQTSQSGSNISPTINSNTGEQYRGGNQASPNGNRGNGSGSVNLGGGVWRFSSGVTVDVGDGRPGTPVRFVK